MFLSRTTEKQVTIYTDLLLTDSENLAELILCIFFRVFCEI